MIAVLLTCGWLTDPGAGLLLYAQEASPQSGAQGLAKLSEADRARHFDREVAPVLVRHCVECHGSTAKKGGLDLSQKAAALLGGSSGEAIVPGDSEESLLWHYVDSGEMPPKNRPPLSDPEKRLLQQWIDAGGVWGADLIGPLPFSDERIEPHREFEYTDEVRDPGPILLRRLTVPEYIQTVRSTVGVDVSRDARRILPPDLRADGFSNTAYNLNVDLANIEAYAQLASIIVGRMDVAAFASQYASSQQLDDSNMREVIAGMGKWLLRGPLEEHEIESFLRISTAVADEGGDFTEAVSYMVEGMLQSPRFIYRIENHHGDGTLRRVGDYELASRLSYILWGGPPDKELMRAADAGELSDRGAVESQVQRMLQDPRAVERSAQFIHDWLNLGQLSNLRPDPERFPQWSEQLAADMREETLAFFKEVVWQQQRPLSDLMNAQVTFATPRLAAHYGLDGSPATSEPVARSDQPAGVPQRIADGLQALYTFDEGGGELVRDVSGAGSPLDLNIEDTSAVQWGTEGLTVKASTLIATSQPPQRLIDAIKKSKAVTLEAWVSPGLERQDGPARILTLSSGISQRNFTLGQDQDKYDVRLRAGRTDANGMPGLASASGSVQLRPTHVVYTRDAAGQAKLYVNGQQQGARDVGGDLSNWNDRFRLALANEFSQDRPWQGTLHLVAVYDRALGAEEVQRHQSAGAGQQGRPAPANTAAPGNWALGRTYFQDDLQVLYRFDEGGGDTIRDASGGGNSLDLKIEDTSAVQWGTEGLTVNASTRIATSQPPRRLIDAIKKSEALTLEAWVTPALQGQDGPARILTLSAGSVQRNFTLGQERDKYDVRLRTSRTNDNGMPGLASASQSVQIRPTHIVYTRDAAGQARLYVNGQQQQTRDVAGDLSNWNDSFRLGLGNESTKDRPWQGTFHRIAVYSRALTPEEVRWQGESMGRYDLADLPARGGLLTQGSLLTMGGDDASMVTRGLFVLHDLLCSKVDDPPPCVDTTPVPTQPGRSQRALAEARLADSSCGGCHARFEPLAFGLEKFDGVGAYFETDAHGNELRDDGEILFPGQEQSVSYQSSAELMDLLAGSQRVRQAITLKVTQFALARPLVKTDAFLLNEIHQSAQDSGGTYAALITAVVMSDLVQMTRTEQAGGE